MGTEFRVVLWARTAARAEAASAAAFARLHALDAALSDYDRESELSRLSRATDAGAPTGPLPVSPALHDVLARAREVSELSGGAFDVTVGPYVRLWRRAFRRRELPSPERLAAARRSVGFAHVRLDARARTVELRVPAMRLDLGGIAKGYALDAMLDELAARGASSALVDGGGDIAVSDPPPGRDGWNVAVDPTGTPENRLRLTLAQAAIATSGDTGRFVEIEGVRYSHLVDPRDGAALSRRIAATVVAARGATADAWASALCVLGPEDGLARAAAQPGVHARVWVLENGAWEACESRGWQRIMAGPDSARVVLEPPGPSHEQPQPTREDPP